MEGKVKLKKEEEEKEKKRGAERCHLARSRAQRAASGISRLHRDTGRPAACGEDGEKDGVLAVLT